MRTIQEITTELSTAFASDKRTQDDKIFWKLKEDSDLPEWLQADAGRDVMHGIHKCLDDRMPDDWVYEVVAHTADSLADYEDADSMQEASHEIADGQACIYNADLTNWLADHTDNAYLCDEACDEFGDPEDMFKRIQYGQLVGITRIISGMISAIMEEFDSQEEE